jgi:hypothetical protein
MRKETIFAIQWKRTTYPYLISGSRLLTPSSSRQTFLVVFLDICIMYMHVRARTIIGD